MAYKIIFLSLFLFPSLLVGANSESYHAHFNLWSIIPFIGILLSIAIFPLINHHFWEKNFGKISAFWAFIFGIPFCFSYGLDIALHYFAHAMILEYIPFIILLFALFTISGGIVLRGNFIGTPKLNLLFLFIGTILASWMGTTGAAMLLIRPLIRANKWRKNKIHIIVFFIFLVANIGGSLTPLGDPPLFLGFLNGISFFWTTTNLFLPMLFISSLLMILFYLIDNYYYKKELDCKPIDEPVNFLIEGKFNFLLLIGVILAVILSGIYKDNLGFIYPFGNGVRVSFILRDIALFLLGLMSYKLTSLTLRKENGFTWFPIIEVAKLFAGIFITIIPVLSILGEKKAIFSTLNDNVYFWLTGILSSFLDNAPTYLVFFNAAGGDPNKLMEGISTLLAISSGAVFMGAMTYIGNAPNFMVRSIAEENKIKMPSFFGYMAWSISILVPILFLYSLLWF
jgi:Na+/H+ antiporter NhaD/arsenite permease-like protein